MALGQACGKAAHLAIKGNVAVRAISVPHLQQSILSDGGTITYFDDLRGGLPTFIAFQWLGARGLNSDYHAEPEKQLTRGEGAERLRRILEHMGHKWPEPISADPSAPLKFEDLATWFRLSGLKAPRPNVNSIDLGKDSDGMKCAVFAAHVYSSLALT
jgi:hypothetical protein